MRQINNNDNNNNENNNKSLSARVQGLQRKSANGIAESVDNSVYTENNPAMGGGLL